MHALATMPLLIDGKALTGSSHRGVTMSWGGIDGVPRPRRDDNWNLRMPSRSLIGSRMLGFTISGGYISEPLEIYIGDVVTVSACIPRKFAGYRTQADIHHPVRANGLLYFDADGRMLVDPAQFAQAHETRAYLELEVMMTDFATLEGMDIEGATTWSYEFSMTKAPA